MRRRRPSPQQTALWFLILFAVAIFVFFLPSLLSDSRASLISKTSMSLDEQPNNNRVKSSAEGTPKDKNAQESSERRARITQVASVLDGLSRACSTDEATKQAQLQLVARIYGCPPPDDFWMQLAQQAMPQAKTFVDIGCNKGYTAARFFELWTPEMGMEAGRLYNAHLSVNLGKDLRECGACDDCKENGVPIMPTLQRLCGIRAETPSNRELNKAVAEHCQRRAEEFEPIHVHSFDGNPEMITGLSRAQDWLANQIYPISILKGVDGVPEARLPKNPLRFLLKHWSMEVAAFSDVYEEGKMMNFNVGMGERGGIVGQVLYGSEHPSGTVSVPVLTVDELVRRDNFAHIDLMKIDTEGHDPSVLRGAKKAFTDHRVTLVIFEYSNTWEAKYSLEEIVNDYFEPMEYACYHEGVNALLKLNFGCWSPKLETRTWSNIWCTSLRRREGRALATLFDSYSMAFA